MAQQRFSATAYAHALNSGSSAVPEGAGLKIARQDQETDAFRQLAEELRGELAAPRGRTEEEKHDYTDTLNRAVLGYDAERRKILAIIQDLLAKKRVQDVPPPHVSFGTLAEAIFAEVIGLGVLELIMKEREGLEEVQVNGTQIFEVRGGIPRLSPYQLPSIKETERLQQNLVLFNSDTLSPRKRWAEVTLRDGSRVTLTGFGYTSQPTLTIRYYTVKSFELDAMCRKEYDTMTPLMAKLLKCLIRSYFNLVITGPTNSGKTTLIKSLIGEMPDHERLVTIESRYELMIKRDFPMKNVIEYEFADDDAQHDGQQAFKLALRQSPKRICHAEIRDEDANIYVRACTRGHEGSVTTVHVSELEDAPDAIADMCMMDGRGMDSRRLTRRITEYVTQIGLEMALVNGQRKLIRIGEFEYSNHEVRVKDWARYDYENRGWHYPLNISERAAARMMRYDPTGFDAILGQKEEA